MADTYVRKGFGLKTEVQDTLATDYSGGLVDLLRTREYTLEAGETTVRLAREFGFCYGVERAVDYAYQTRVKFPDKRIFLAGEIIHNPHVNAKLRDMGISFLSAKGTGFDYAPVRPDDVVILPAFGVTIHDFETLRAMGCVVVDTTCGSVLNVWKRVEAYARDGFTSLIHGKYYHEETRATASQAEKYPGGMYLVVRDMDEANLVMDYIEGSQGRPTPRPALSRDAFASDLRIRRIQISTLTGTSRVSVSPIKQRCWRASRSRLRAKLATRWNARTGRSTGSCTSVRSTRFAARRRIARMLSWNC